MMKFFMTGLFFNIKAINLIETNQKLDFHLDNLKLDVCYFDESNLYQGIANRNYVG